MRKKKLEENIRFMFMWAFHPPDIVQIRKLLFPLKNGMGTYGTTLLTAN